jgi:exodeoxyribonuclease VII small subunit
MTRDKKPPAEPTFEAIARLETIVGSLEGGDAPLEESLQLFEEGVRLSRACMQRLEAAERRIEILLKDEAGGADRAVPFAADGEE